VKAVAAWLAAAPENLKEFRAHLCARCAVFFGCVWTVRGALGTASPYQTGMLRDFLDAEELAGFGEGEFVGDGV
jgi:hypothetical protein